MLKYTLTLFVILFIAEYSQAQTGIGTTSPNASAKLDVFSDNKGFLPPRVSIDSSKDITSIVNPAEGLLVYNTGTVGLQAGYYYWNGASWATIATASSAGNGVTSSDMVKLYSKAYSAATADSNIANATGYKFTVPVSGRYLFDFSSSGYVNQTSMTITFKVRQGTTDLATDAQTGNNNNVHVEYNGKLEVNLQAGVTYNVYVTTTGSRDAGDWDRVYYKMVSGNLPVTGQSVDYISVGSINLTGVGDNRDLIFSTNFGGNIPYNTSTGVFTLSANKTYLFQAQVRVNAPSASGNYIEYGFVDAISNVLLVNGTQTITSSTTSTAGFGSNPVINFIYTPSSNQTVKIRTTSTTTGTQTVVSGTANITQIGSSAIINPWTLSGTNTYNTTGNVGIGTSSPNTKLEVNGTASAHTLSLSNSTIGTPSLVLRNGDASATYSDIAQVKMGWSGSAAGKSQYAQFIHSRHNSGATGNAIDIYLSDGTADNTIITGSTKALSIESPGNLTLAGKINLTDASGNVAVKAASFVNAGVAVTLGDIQVIMSTSGSRSLQIRTTGSSFTGMASAHTTYANGSYTYYSDKSFTVDANYGYIGGVTWSFGNDGDLSVYYVRDTTNQRFYRFTLMVGNVTAYTNNFISIERLL